MSDRKESKHIHYLKSLFSEGKINRREFLHSSTMLGLSATAAYTFAGKVAGTGPMPAARAADLRGQSLLQPEHGGPNHQSRIP